ncbi:HNH endonuclease [Motiliproteus sediminis]|uniref:HNH endonuclease n=1 Tax=Motiliproteus sediminis TaxID=1468178 RepID=UPI001AF01C08|nr:HNH endonuclease [Motiliproteus sediminis]
MARQQSRLTIAPLVKASLTLSTIMIFEHMEIVVASEKDLHEELLSLYRRTGEATNYWPNYFLRTVRTEGGLSVAKKLLGPGKVSAGFDRLIEAKRMDLSVESIALEPRFSHLFTKQELEVAKDRLSSVNEEAFPKLKTPSSDIDEEALEFLEGRVCKITVNAYERDPRARDACIRHHGTVCAVCRLNFEDRYGEIGRGFIHVHHKRPLSVLGDEYKVNPQKDLVPVCPNCHAMLHRRNPPYDVEQLRGMLKNFE